MSRNMKYFSESEVWNVCLSLVCALRSLQATQTPCYVHIGRIFISLDGSVKMGDSLSTVAEYRYSTTLHILPHRVKPHRLEYYCRKEDSSVSFSLGVTLVRMCSLNMLGQDIWSHIETPSLINTLIHQLLPKIYSKNLKDFIVT
jgi:hypothetical protein